MSNLPATYVKGFHDEESVRKMKYNELGNTGLKLSFISLGGGVFSHLYENFDEEEAIATIREGIRKGINFIDTSPWYGQGSSEILIGKALKNIPREAYYIGSKVGRYDYVNMFDFSHETTIEAVNTGLKRLGIDYFDIIQAHDVEFSKTVEEITKTTLPALESLKREGKIRFMGITGYSLNVLQKVIELSNVKVDVVLSYARNTLIDSSLEAFIPFFQEKGIGIICAADHAMGLLTNAGPQPWHPAPQHIKDICAMAALYCKEKGVEFGKLALNHSISQQNVATHLIGMSNRKILDTNLSAFYGDLTPKEAEVLEEIRGKYLKPILNTHWEGVELKKYHESN